jgi:hypothetical protein
MVLVPSCLGISAKARRMADRRGSVHRLNET